MTRIMVYRAEEKRPAYFVLRTYRPNCLFPSVKKMIISRTLSNWEPRCQTVVPRTQLRRLCRVSCQGTPWFLLASIDMEQRRNLS